MHDPSFTNENTKKSVTCDYCDSLNHRHCRISHGILPLNQLRHFRLHLLQREPSIRHWQPRLHFYQCRINTVVISDVDMYKRWSYQILNLKKKIVSNIAPHKANCIVPTNIKYTGLPYKCFPSSSPAWMLWRLRRARCHLPPIHQEL